MKMRPEIGLIKLKLNNSILSLRNAKLQPFLLISVRSDFTPRRSDFFILDHLLE